MPFALTTVFRFATVAVLTGNFVFHKAATDFLVLSVMGVLVGLAIADVLIPDPPLLGQISDHHDPNYTYSPLPDVYHRRTFSLVGRTGCGKWRPFLSFRAKDYLDYNTRLQTKEVWATAGFLLNGFVFILIGLELPTIMEGLEKYSMGEAMTMP